MYRSMITQTALATLEKGINKLILLDPAAMEQLVALEGKTIAIYSTIPNYHFVIIPTIDGVFLTHSNELPVDVELTAPAATLLQLLLSRNKEAYLRKADLTIAGNTGVLYQFFRILDNLNPDWEYELSQWFSPALVALATQTIKTSNQQIKQGVAFIQTQFNQLFDNNTEQPNNKERPTPFSLLIDTVEKRFKKS